MARRSATARVEKWWSRFSADDSQSLSPVFKRLRDSAHAEQLTIIPALVALEDSTRGVLNGLGVATFLFPAFFGLTRKLWSLQNRGVSGVAFAAEANNIAHLWVARGLNVAHVTVVLNDLFGVAYVP